MAALGKLVVEISADANKLIAGMDQSSAEVVKLKSNLEKLSGSVEKSSNAAAASLERGLQRSLIETTAAMQGFTRGTSGFAEIEAKLKGVKLDPELLASLKAVEAQQKSNISSNLNYSKSTKELGFALRNVPAQISDIVVSLQGGQRPLTVFLQQGAQLKDLFGGVGPALKGLATGFIGLINPLTLAGGAIAGLTAAYAAGANESTRLNTALINSGNVAGGTASSFTALAGDVAKLTGNYGTAREAVEALVASGLIAGRDIPNALRGIVDGVAVTGKSVQDVTKDFEKLATEPLKGLLELNKTQNFLTVGTYEQIKALEKQGKTQEAATLAQKTYADVLQSRRNEVVENLGYFERAWKAIKEESGFALDNFLKIGRIGVPAEQLAQERFNLSRLQSGGFRGSGKGSANDIADQQAKIAGLERDFSLAASRAAAVGAQRQRNKQIIGAKEFLDEKTLANNPIEKINREFAPALAVFAKGTSEFIALEKLRDEAIAKVNAPAQRKAQSAALKEINAERKYALDILKEEIDNELLLANEVGEAYAKSLEEKAKAQSQFTESLQKSLDVSQDLASREQDRVADIQRQIDVFGQSEQAVSALEAAKLLDAAATYEQSIALMQANGATKEQIDWTYQQIEAIKARGKAIEQYGVKSAELEGLKEAKKAQEEYLKNINEFGKKMWDTLTKSGGNAFKNLKEAAKTYFFDWLYELTAKKWFINIGATITGTALSGSASASTGGASGIGSLLSGGGGIGGGLGNLVSSLFKGAGAQFSALDGIVQSFSNTIGNAGFPKLASALFQNSSAISSALPYAGAALSLLTGDIKGAATSAIGTAIGSFTPLGPIGGAIIGSFIGKALGGLFGGAKLPPRLYSAQKTTLNGNVFEQVAGRPLKSSYDSAGANSGLGALNESALKAVSTLFKGFDIGGTLSAFSAVSKKKSADGSIRIYLDGEALGGFSTGKIKKGSIQGVFDQLSSNLGSAITSFVKNSPLSDGVKKFFAVISSNDDVSDAINTLTSLNKSLSDLPPVFNAIRNAIDTTDYETSIADLKSRFSAVGTYTSLFYTQAEQFDTFTKQITTQFSALNTALPKSRDEYRALVDGIKVTDESTSNLFHGLVALAPAMDSYFKSLQSQREELEAINAQTFGSARFTTQAEQSAFAGISRNYDSRLAYDYVSNLGAGNIGNTNNGATTVDGSINVDVIKLLKELRDYMKENLSVSEGSRGALERISVLGISSNA